jgi:hypothetical protein
MTDDTATEAKAQQLYQERAAREQAAHGQIIVPWGEIGESLKESFRSMAKLQLGNA